MQLRTLAVDFAGVAWTGHIKQQIVGIVIPAHVLHLAVVVARNLPQINSIKWLLVLIVDFHNELIVSTARRTTIEGEPSDVDTLGDELLKILGLLATRQVFVLLLLAQAVDGSVGLVFHCQHRLLPAGAVIFH